MTDGDAPPDDASDPAGSGRAHGTAEPRPRWPTPQERIWAHYAAQLRQWSRVHRDPYLNPPKSDAPSAPEAEDPPAPARAVPHAHADHTDRPGVLRWLPASLQRLYRRLVEARPYARKTR